MSVKLNDYLVNHQYVILEGNVADNSGVGFWRIIKRADLRVMYVMKYTVHVLERYICMYLIVPPL